MHPGLLSSSSLLLRPDTDQALLDDFLTQHDITRDVIPPQYAHAQSRTGNVSVNSGAAYKPLPATHVDPDAEPIPGGYAAKYSRGKDGQATPVKAKNSVDADRRSVNAGRPKQQLDTVSEGDTAEADWDLLSSVAYGSYDEQHGTGGKTDQNKQEEGRPKEQQESHDWGDDARDEGEPQTPLDRATEASLKGAHPTLSDIIGSRNESTATPGKRSVELSRPASNTASLAGADPREEGAGIDSPVNAPPVALAASGNTQKQTTPQASARSRQGFSGDPLPYDELDNIIVDEKEQSEREQEKPMNNRLDWQPATPNDDANQPRSTPPTNKKTPTLGPMNNTLQWQPATPTDDTNQPRSIPPASKKTPSPEPMWEPASSRAEKSQENVDKAENNNEETRINQPSPVKEQSRRNSQASPTKMQSRRNSQASPTKMQSRRNSQTSLTKNGSRRNSQIVSPTKNESRRNSQVSPEKQDSATKEKSPRQESPAVEDSHPDGDVKPQDTDEAVGHWGQSPEPQVGRDAEGIPRFEHDKA